MKKHYWHAFWHEKLFEKHPQPHCQTRFKKIMQTAQPSDSIKPIEQEERHKNLASSF
jgi:hypothetical protein